MRANEAEASSRETATARRPRRSAGTSPPRHEPPSRWAAKERRPTNIPTAATTSRKGGPSRCSPGTQAMLHAQTRSMSARWSIGQPGCCESDRASRSGVSVESHLHPNDAKDQAIQNDFDYFGLCADEPKLAVSGPALDVGVGGVLGQTCHSASLSRHDLLDRLRPLDADELLVEAAVEVASAGSGRGPSGAGWWRAGA